MEVVLSGMITKEKDHLQIAFAKKAIPSLSSFSNTVYRKLQSLEPGVSQAQPAALHWEMILNNLLWLVKAFPYVSTLWTGQNLPTYEVSCFLVTLFMIWVVSVNNFNLQQVT